MHREHFLDGASVLIYEDIIFLSAYLGRVEFFFCASEKMLGQRQFVLFNGDEEVNENNHTDDDLMAMLETWPPDSVELSFLWQSLIYFLILHFPLSCCQFAANFYCARKFLTANGCRCGAR